MGHEQGEGGGARRLQKGEQFLRLADVLPGQGHGSGHPQPRRPGQSHGAEHVPEIPLPAGEAVVTGLEAVKGEVQPLHAPVRQSPEPVRQFRLRPEGHPVEGEEGAPRGADGAEKGHRPEQVRVIHGVAKGKMEGQIGPVFAHPAGVPGGQRLAPGVFGPHGAAGPGEKTVAAPAGAGDAQRLHEKGHGFHGGLLSGEIAGGRTGLI